MLKQSQNYSMLYNTNKKIRDKEKHELKLQNEKLTKKNKEVEENYNKLKEELESYKKQIVNFDLGNNAPKKKIVMKPKKKLQPPQKSEESRSKPTDYVPHKPETPSSTAPPTLPSKAHNPSSDSSTAKPQNPKTIQPKTNTASSLKAPLKTYPAKSEKVTYKFDPSQESENGKSEVG